MKKLIKILNDHIEEYLMATLLASMSIIIFAQVIGRYVFNNSLSWSEEAARYIFIWLVYLAISYGVLKDAHIRVDAVVIILPKKTQKAARIFADILFLIFAIAVIYYGLKVTNKIMNSLQRSPAIGMPMYFVYFAIPFGFILTTVRLVQAIIKRFKSASGAIEGAVDGTSTGSV